MRVPIRTNKREDADPDDRVIAIHPGLLPDGHLPLRSRPTAIPQARLSPRAERKHAQLVRRPISSEITRAVGEFEPEGIVLWHQQESERERDVISPGFGWGEPAWRWGVVGRKNGVASGHGGTGHEARSEAQGERFLVQHFPLPNFLADPATVWTWRLDLQKILNMFAREMESIARKAVDEELASLLHGESRRSFGIGSSFAGGTAIE